MKYFVTGATGFIGGTVVRQLRARGDQVNAIVRDRNKATELTKLGVDLFPGDVTDRESMRPAMQGVDGVFHIAGWYKVGTRDKSGGETVNVQGTRHMLELMKELEIPKGVYTSTLAVNSDTHGQLVNETYHFTGKHLSEYDRTKAGAHEIARRMAAEGLPLVIALPGMIYGPGDTSSLRESILQYLKRKLPALPARTAMCWAHVEDIASGHILLMEKGGKGQSYIIAGEPVELANVFHIAQEITGIPAPATLPYPVFSTMAILARPFDSLLPSAYTSEALRVIAGVTYLGDNSKARRELGYKPRPFRQGWEETLRHEMSLLGMK